MASIRDTRGIVLTTGTKWHSKLTRYYNNVIKSQGNSSSVLPFVGLINQKLVENDGQVMFLTYENATSLNLVIQTDSTQDWQVDWDGSGDWQTWDSSASARTKAFSTPTSGVAFIRSATGNSIEDINHVQSDTGNWDFDISALSNVSYQVFFNGNNMTLTGDISALSNVSYYVRLSGNNMTLTGDISSLSNVSYYVHFEGSLMTLTGDISALSNVSYYVHFNGSNMSLTGDISALSNVSYQVYFNGSNMTLTGDISALSNVSYQAYFWGNDMTLTGDISALSNVSYQAYFRGNNMTLAGDISALSNVSYYVYFSGSLMTLTGDISALSNASFYVYFSGSLMTLTYTTSTWGTIPSNTFFLRLSSGHLTQAEVDQLFVDLDNAGTTGNATIDFRGSNAAPSSASASARTALASRGYNVLYN